jgi:hypothetical protein
MIHRQPYSYYNSNSITSKWSLGPRWKAISSHHLPRLLLGEAVVFLHFLLEKRLLDHVLNLNVLLDGGGDALFESGNLLFQNSTAPLVLKRQLLLL